eukprot:1518926-Amphidinium_carterae.2
MVTELRSQVDRHKQQFRDRVCETVEAEVKQKSEQIVELQNQVRQGGDENEVAQLREQLALEKAKLEHLAWKEEVRAKDIHEARETILRGNSQHHEKIAEAENLKTVLADVVKESRNQGVSLSGTAWSQTPPEGLTDFIDQVDISEAEGLMALALATSMTPMQDLAPTSIAIFNEVETQVADGDGEEEQLEAALR